jgi:hypothetical protein
VGTEMEAGSTGDAAAPPSSAMDAQAPPTMDAQAPAMDAENPPPTDAQAPPEADAQRSCTQDNDCPSADYCAYALPAYPTPTGCSEQGTCQFHDIGPVCNVVLPACGCDGTSTAVPGCGEAFVTAPFAHYGNCEGGM